jgi:hypothetical protein
MARSTNQPSTATQRNTAKTRAETGPLDEQNQRSEDKQLDDNDERRENLTAVRDEQADERNDSRDERENANANRRDEREFGENRDRDERRDSGEYAEQDSRREQLPAMSAGIDTFAPVLEAWQQVFKSWSDLTEAMVKVQRDAFASMTGAGNTTAKDITLGENRSGEDAFPGSRTTASTPDRIERDRR